MLDAGDEPADQATVAEVGVRASWAVVVGSLLDDERMVANGPCEPGRTVAHQMLLPPSTVMT
jgi:hypothetical protein